MGNEGWGEGGSEESDRANKGKGKKREREKERGREGRMGVLPICLAMAFSGVVPAAKGWEFPSTQAGRKATEDVFFRAGQECPSLGVFPLLVGVLYKFRVSHCRPSRSLCISPSADTSTFQQRRVKEETFLPRGTEMSALKRPILPHYRLDYTSQHAPPYKRRRCP